MKVCKAYESLKWLEHFAWTSVCRCMILVLLIFFVGKQVIHPNQIAVVQEQFSPSPEKIKWAQELISAFEEHQRLGKVNTLLICHSTNQI